MGPRTGSKTVDFQIHPGLPPGPFRKLTGISVTTVESRPPFAPVPLADGTHFEGWREFVRIDDPETRVELESEDGHPALTARGRVHYVAGRPDARLARRIVRSVMQQSGLTPIELHRDIRVRDNGPWRLIFNYGPETQHVAGLIGDAEVLMGGAQVPPCGVTIVRPDSPNQ